MTNLSNIPTRQVIIEGQEFTVPRGIGRNTRNRSWQVKVVRNGEVTLSGNFADDQYENASGSLAAAVSLLSSSEVAQETRSSIQLTERVNLTWAPSGPGVVGMVAAVYNPDIKRATNVYLISQGKMASGKTEGLKEKIVKALERSWKQENNRQSVPMIELLKMRNDVDELMGSERFHAFCAAAPAKKIKDK